MGYLIFFFVSTGRLYAENTCASDSLQSFCFVTLQMAIVIVIGPAYLYIMLPFVVGVVIRIWERVHNFEHIFDLQPSALQLARSVEPDSSSTAESPLERC